MECFSLTNKNYVIFSLLRYACYLYTKLTPLSRFSTFGSASFHLNVIRPFIVAVFPTTAHDFCKLSCTSNTVCIRNYRSNMTTLKVGIENRASFRGKFCKQMSSHVKLSGSRHWITQVTC